MYVEVECTDGDYTASNITDDGTFTAVDPEFSLVIDSPALSAEWALLRESRSSQPTTALVDGSARARRDRRVARRAGQQNDRWSIQGAGSRNGRVLFLHGRPDLKGE